MANQEHANFVREPEGVAPPPRFLLWLVVGLFLLIVIGGIGVVLLMNNRPALVTLFDLGVKLVVLVTIAIVIGLFLTEEATPSTCFCSGCYCTAGRMVGGWYSVHCGVPKQPRPWAARSNQSDSAVYEDVRPTPAPARCFLTNTEPRRRERCIADGFTQRTIRYRDTCSNHCHSGGYSSRGKSNPLAYSPSNPDTYQHTG